MLSRAAHDLVYRKKRIPSAQDRSCHQAPRSTEFLVIRPSLAVSTASCRHLFQLSFLLRGRWSTAKRTAYQTACPHLENDVEALRSIKMLQPQIPSQRPKQTPHEATRAANPETGSRVDDPNNRQDQKPEFALSHLYKLPPAGRGKLIKACLAGSLLGLYTEASSKKWWGKDSPHRCRGSTGGH